MRVTRYKPASILQPYVQYIDIAETVAASMYKVIPGTSLVMGIQYKGALFQKTGEQEILLDSTGITGLLDTYRVFKNSAGTGTVLIYFTATGASHFFSNPLNELFALSISLDNLVPASSIEILQEKLAAAVTGAQRVAVVEQFLLSRLRVFDDDRLVLAALEQINLSKGLIRIAGLAKKLYTSQSPLEKRFRKIVGTTPKKYASITRVTTLINQYEKSKSLANLGYSAGYFDQSHFIKDFTFFTGETPENFFAARP